MFCVIRLKKIGSAAALICFLLAGFILLRSVSVYRVMQTAELAANPPVLVIDPGHGGFDGGAIAVNGARESDINLAIALKLEALAAFCGSSTVMTRNDDSRKTDLLSYSEHEDLVYRAQVANQIPDAVLVSIHQNYYPTTQPCGARVLYASDAQSARLGKLVQANLVSFLQGSRILLAAHPLYSRLWEIQNRRFQKMLAALRTSGAGDADGRLALCETICRQLEEMRP